MGEIRGLKYGKNIERIIAELEIDEGGWTKPTSLEIHYEVNSYLFLEEHVYPKFDKESEKTLYVKRIGPNKDDFIVDTSKVDYVWDKLIVDPEDYEEEIQDLRIAVLGYEKPLKEKSIEEQIIKAVENQEFEIAAKLKLKLERKNKRNSQKPL
ncbi:hypothetical protein CO037_01625 [Candidatus Pacearchaeota archaeon CG_4_9_14_0_2_um_filter_30_8]|nr:MAG: hypothetical protein CO037_01625 [Candidatus Pacearchaeota archaeon CG_4_9_14_0_2_um_filter_30_8]